MSRVSADSPSAGGGARRRGKPSSQRRGQRLPERQAPLPSELAKLRSDVLVQGHGGALLLWGVLNGSTAYDRGQMGLGADGFGQASLWVFIRAPLIGGVLAALAHNYLFPPREDGPAEIVLPDVEAARDAGTYPEATRTRTELSGAGVLPESGGRAWPHRTV